MEIKNSNDKKLSYAHIKLLNGWLRDQYPLEVLKIWRKLNTSNIYDYFIQTGSKESRFYIYTIMKKFDVKCKFEEYDPRLKMIFPQK